MILQWMLRLAGTCGLLMAIGSAAAVDFRLGLPLACDIGTTCWVQQYADHDTGAGVKDFACGEDSYDGHDGTDIRVRSLVEKVDVVASAAGTVRGLRNDVPDRLMLTEEDKKAVAKVECGNGVVLVHDDGWETQYCHMRQGSVAVRAGQVVAAGQKLGEVGASGQAAFAHVHLSVRKGGVKIDPFAGPVNDNCGQGGVSLWHEAIGPQLSHAGRGVVDAGFLPGLVELDDLERGTVQAQPIKNTWTAAIGFVRVINVQAGDRIALSFSGPNGLHAENIHDLDRHKATFLLLSGVRQPAQGWPKGRYQTRVQISHDGTVISDTVRDTTLE